MAIPYMAIAAGVEGVSSFLAAQQKAKELCFRIFGG